MASLIKKIKKIASITAIILVCFPLSIYFIIQIPAIQTAAVHWVTDRLQEHLPQSTISVGAVHFSFFNKLVVTEIYASDIHSDTLLYIGHAAVTLTGYNPVSKIITLGSINLYNGIFNFQTKPVGNNIKEILTEFKNTPDTTSNAKKGFPLESIKIGDISLTNFRFTLKNMRNPSTRPPSSSIDFKDLALNNINIDIRNLKLSNDTLFFQIRDLNFSEKSGYHIKHLSANTGLFCSNQIKLEKVIIDDSHSLLTMRSYAMDFKDGNDFGDYEEKVKMTADFDNAIFSFKTISHYARNFNVDNLTLRLNGKASGTVNNLRSDHLQIKLIGGTTDINTSFKMIGLPDINKTSLILDIDYINTNAEDLSHILSNLVKKYGTATDKIIKNLGDIHYTGNYTGLYDDFVVRGNLSTSIGDATLDMLLHEKDGKGFSAEGDLETHGFNLGKFLNTNILGKVDANIYASMTFNPSEYEDFDFKIKGKVSRFDFNHYRYSHLAVDGTLSNRHFDGKIEIEDPALNMDFNGYLAFSDGRDSSSITHHNYTANITHANLSKLNFNTRDSVSELKARIVSNYQYTNAIDAGTGRLEISDVFYHDPLGVHNMGTMTLLFTKHENIYHSQLRSTFADANFKGNYPFLQFIKDVSHASYAKYIPCLVDSVTYTTDRKVDYDFNLRIKRTESIAYLVDPEFFIAENTRMGITLTPDNKFSATFNSPMLALGNEKLRRISMQADNTDNQINVTIDVNTGEFMGIPVKNIAGYIQSSNDNVKLDLAYDNESTPVNTGDLHFSANFSKPKGKAYPLIDINILPSTITLSDTLWSTASSNIRIDKDLFSFNKLQIFNQHQLIAINGAFSHSPTDTLDIHLNNVDMSNFDPLTTRRNYALKGNLSGFAKITGVFDTLMFHADFKGQSIEINNHPFGELLLLGNWDNGKKLFQIYMDVTNKGQNILHLDGTYIPRQDILDISSTLNHFPAVHIEPMINSVLTNVSGYLSGNLKAQGSLKTPLLYGSNVILDSLGLTVDYLKTHYTLTVPVDITPNTISIHNAVIYDQAGGRGILSGSLHHKYFRELNYNITLLPENMLCLNTSMKDNSAFYGKAYTTGVVQIKGDDDELNFDITARTNPNTVLHIPLESSSQAKESSILTFAQPVAVDEYGWTSPNSRLVVKSGQKMKLDMNITATPDAEVQIIFDEKAGDIIRGRGSGNLRLSLEPDLDKFDLYGDYSIEQGDYFFTLQNIISKKFIMEQGSRIAFNGDINKTMLDISAIYKTKTSLSTLTEDTSAASRVRRNVDCKIHVMGNLFTPTLAYDVEVQNLDPSTRAQVQSALNTEEKKTRQFLSLLAFNSFMPDQQSGISNINLSASASEILSNQLSNMLTQLNIPFDVGFVYNTQDRGNSAFDLAISTQLFDNRVAINGTFGNGQTNSADNTFTGDLDIELKIDRQGRFRVKAFTHSADQFTDQFDNSQRSGVGFVYQEDFNNFKELFDRWFHKRKKKPEKKTEMLNKKEEEKENILEFSNTETE
jgi:hypothetical protein